MKRTEAVYREILYKVFEEKQFKFTQSGLSKKLKISLSVVNLAVKKLESIGAVKISQRSFNVLDAKKILYFWASVRNLKKDILFKVRINAPVREIERVMPDVKFTAYTAYKLHFKDVPADYSEVYTYADINEAGIIKKRISKLKTLNINENFFVLKKDPLMELYKKIPLSQIFVDLWNLKEWYAKDFIDNFERRLF